MVVVNVYRMQMGTEMHTGYKWLTSSSTYLYTSIFSKTIKLEVILCTLCY